MLGIVKDFDCLIDENSGKYQITFTDFIAALQTKKLINNKEVLKFAFGMLDVDFKKIISPSKLLLRSELNNLLIPFDDIKNSMGSGDLDYLSFEQLFSNCVENKKRESSTGSENPILQPVQIIREEEGH